MRGAAVAAQLKKRGAWRRDGSGARSRSRRVAVKARVVRLNPQRGALRGRSFVSAKAVDAHLRYLQRDGVTRDGEKGQVYSAERDLEDGDLVGVLRQQLGQLRPVRGIEPAAEERARAASPADDGAHDELRDLFLLLAQVVIGVLRLS